MFHSYVSSSYVSLKGISAHSPEAIPFEAFLPETFSFLRSATSFVAMDKPFGVPSAEHSDGLRTIQTTQTAREEVTDVFVPDKRYL